MAISTETLPLIKDEVKEGIIGLGDKWVGVFPQGGGRVIISSKLRPSPDFIKLFGDMEYVVELRAKLVEIRRLLRS